MRVEPNKFNVNGRLLALSGTAYSIAKKVPKDLRPPDGLLLQSPRNFLTVWDTETGKVVKAWDLSAQYAFNPVKPILAVLEPNRDQTRLGFWDFSAEPIPR